jgi:hypothetical protein
MALHGSSRFEVVRDPSENAELMQAEQPLPEQKTIQRVGYRWQEINAAGERQWVHGIFPDIFDREIAGHPRVRMSGREARARLFKAGLIRGKTEGGKMRYDHKLKRIPGAGVPRLILTAPDVE